MVCEIFRYKYVAVTVLINLICLNNKHLGHGRIYPTTSEFEYTVEDSSELKKDLRTDSEFEKSMQRREGIYKDGFTVESLASLVYDFMNISYHIAVHKWKNGIPVENKTEEANILEAVEKQAKHLEGSVEKIRMVYKDIIESMKIIQYALISDWNAKIYANRMTVSKKSKNITKIEKDLVRLQDYTVISIDMLSDLMKEQYCVEIVERIIEKARDHYFDKIIQLYSLERSMGSICNKYYENPRENITVIAPTPPPEVIRYFKSKKS